MVDRRDLRNLCSELGDSATLIIRSTATLKPGNDSAGREDRWIGGYREGAEDGVGGRLRSGGWYLGAWVEESALLKVPLQV